MISIVHSIMLSYGWRRCLTAFGSGALGALALPPVSFFPAIVLPMCVGVWLLDGAASLSVKSASLRRSRWPSLRTAMTIGWWLGFGYFMAGLWWLGAAFLVEADQFAWALPLGVMGLPALLACFTAIGFAAAHLLWCAGSVRVLAFAICLAGSEWARGVLFTGFPWNDLGMSLAGNIVTAQAASLVGLHGMTLLAVLIFAAPATLADRTTGRAGGRYRAVIGAALLLAAIAIFGGLRLAGGAVENEAGVKLRLMQPNLPQDAKFRPENKDPILKHYLELSDSATSPGTSGLADITHLIWPESAFPFILSRDAGALSRIGEALGSTVLVTGAARVELDAAILPGETKASYFNSIQVVGAGGVVLDSYDKTHLVPFGEYLPFASVLESLGVRQFVHIPGGFESGQISKLLTIPGLPAALPLICYEAIFPGAVPPDLRQASGFLLNVTNDGWFGVTPGPYQHLAQARVRSIEQGLPLLRAANTGISAIVDPYGRLVASLPLGVEGVLDGALPKRIDATLFSQAPVGMPLSLYGVALFFLLFMRMRR